MSNVIIQTRTHISSSRCVCVCVTFHLMTTNSPEESGRESEITHTRKLYWGWWWYFFPVIFKDDFVHFDGFVNQYCMCVCVRVHCTHTFEFLSGSLKYTEKNTTICVISSRLHRSQKKPPGEPLFEILVTTTLQSDKPTKIFCLTFFAFITNCTIRDNMKFSTKYTVKYIKKKTENRLWQFMRHNTQVIYSMYYIRIINN